MDGYHLALFIHLLALMAAVAASALVHLADARRARAATPRDALAWHALAGSAARTFPIALLLLAATGAVMVETSEGLEWAAGWVATGLLGVVALLASGGVIAVRSRREARELARLAASDSARGAPPPDAVVETLSWVNTGLAVAVILVMSTKPPLVESLVALAVGAAGGLVLGLTMRGDVATPQAVQER